MCKALKVDAQLLACDRMDELRVAPRKRYKDIDVILPHMRIDGYNGISVALTNLPLLTRMCPIAVKTVPHISQRAVLCILRVHTIFNSPHTAKPIPFCDIAKKRENLISCRNASHKRGCAEAVIEPEMVPSASNAVS